MNTVFIVDDDIEYLEVMSFTLRKFGYKVVLVMDPTQLGVLLQSERPDLIILDIQMPGGGGPLAESIIRDNPGTAGTPILVATGMPVEEALAWFRSRNPSLIGVVKKPFSPELVLKKVQELILAADSGGVLSSPM